MLLLTPENPLVMLDFWLKEVETGRQGVGEDIQPWNNEVKACMFVSKDVQEDVLEALIISPDSLSTECL